MYALLIVIIILEALLILRLMVKLRTRRYDGNLLVDDSEETTTLALEILTIPEQLVQQKSITLKVVKEAE